MNKPKAQGTAFESSLVRQAQDAGLMAGRFPEGGKWDAGDVWIYDTPTHDGADIAILAWSRLVKGEGSRRVADGVRSVIVIDTDDFFKLCAGEDLGFVVECKATETLNVTRTLANAKRKLAKWKAR